MSNDDLSEDDIRKMEAKLLGYSKPPTTSVEVRRSKLKAEKRKKPHIEIEMRKHGVFKDEILFDIFVCSEKVRGKVQEGLYSDELKAALKPYQDEGTEIRCIDANGLKWIRSK
ncbi:hypothetical protein G6L13_05550 [Agrobacterium tumefaciens]|uniref:hypothetical protein n=1 Tax=Agrobacterium tumefaciens TaxID=358 RepID=UPI001572EAB4|nr:hypothetical protein [Agrobacterium tumefaciens]NTA79949.1 hypothetical protein [Agrobacterium tumefaciens]